MIIFHDWMVRIIGQLLTFLFRDFLAPEEMERVGGGVGWRSVPMSPVTSSLRKKMAFVGKRNDGKGNSVGNLCFFLLMK